MDALGITLGQLSGRVDRRRMTRPGAKPRRGKRWRKPAKPGERQ
jgi:hypothetical protein